MKYIKVTFRTDEFEEYVNDLIASFLGETGFESFEENGRGITGYCPANHFSETTMQEAVMNIPGIEGGEIQYRIEEMEDKNWNKNWEENSFHTIEISKECVIRPKHEQPEHHYKYDIVLQPQQSFGTGYHETTRLMLQYLMETEIKGKRVLDMGTGTGVLAIMAAFRGAEQVMAVDIDEWSYRNAIENIELNDIEGVEVCLGDASILEKEETRFDIVLANINRNILLADMQRYASVMDAGGLLVVSGFLCEDIAILKEKATSLRLQTINTFEENNWASIQFKK